MYLFHPCVTVDAMIAVKCILEIDSTFRCRVTSEIIIFILTLGNVKYLKRQATVGQFCTSISLLWNKVTIYLCVFRREVMHVERKWHILLTMSFLLITSGQCMDSKDVKQRERRTLLDLILQVIRDNQQRDKPMSRRCSSGLFTSAQDMFSSREKPFYVPRLDNSRLIGKLIRFIFRPWWKHNPHFTVGDSCHYRSVCASYLEAVWNYGTPPYASIYQEYPSKTFTASGSHCPFLSNSVWGSYVTNVMKVYFICLGIYSKTLIYLPWRS